MQLFYEIFTTITLPILLLVALGFGAQKYTAFDLPTLSKLQIYVLIPCGILHFLISTKLPLHEAWPAAWFTVAQFAVHCALGFVAATLFGVTGPARTILMLASGFNNSGNYGLPLVQLTFPPDYLLHQTVVLSMHTVLFATFGLWMLARHGAEKPGVWETVFGTPMIPAVIAGFALKELNVTLPVSLALPLKLMGEAFTPLALFLLGAQLAEVKANGGRVPLTLSLIVKLALAPAVTWGLAAYAGFPDELTALFVLGAATPIGVMVAIFAARYDTEPGLTASMVFVSTVVSALTITAWIFIMKLAGLMPAMP